MKKLLLAIFGFLFLGLGGIGLFLPVWPTTPFVLLSVGCFSASPKIRERIMKIGFIREHYENYKMRGGLRPRTLVVSLVFLWGMLLLSMLLMNKLWAYILLLAVGTAVTVHLFFISKAKNPPSVSAETAREDELKE